MEPMLLEDFKPGQTPRSVANLLKYFQSLNLAPDKNDYIVGFVHILMLESGFVLKDNATAANDYDFNFQRLLRYSRSLPENWKKDSTYVLDYVLSPMMQCPCKIMCMTAGDDLLINCMVRDLANFSLLIDPLTYFITSAVNLNKPTFQNLDHLSRNFKTEIALRAKITIVEAGRGICACLHNLPLELHIKIMTYLKHEEVLNLAKTCKDLCRAASDPLLWMRSIDWEFRKKGIHKTPEELKFLFEIKFARVLTKIMSKGSES